MPQEVRKVTHSCGCVRLYPLEDAPRDLKERMVEQLEAQPCGELSCPRRVEGHRRLLARVMAPTVNGKGES